MFLKIGVYLGFGIWDLQFVVIRAGEVIAPREGGGKSELRRARRSRNGTGGDPMDSATEKKTARKGKGETVG